MSESKSAFKVSDRRTFHADGRRRSEEELAEVPEPPVVITPEPAIGRASPHSDRGESAEFTFLSFAASLATNAMAALGIEPGRGQVGPGEPELARQYIDILAMLQEKTKGNLTAQESAGLQRMITELRLLFVDKKQPRGQLR